MGTLRELHPNPKFTKYLVEKRFFENDPLLIIDVGSDLSSNENIAVSALDNVT